MTAPGIRRARRIVTAAAAAAIGLSGIVATAPVAVGNTHTPTVWHADPDPTAEGVALVAVDADRSHDAWAVGQRFSVKHPNTPRRGAVEHWDGKNWRGATAPAGAVDLSSVSARSPKDVWVGGLHNESSGPMAVWHFNGKTWKRVTRRGLPHFNSGNVLAVHSHIWFIGEVDTGRPDGGAVIATYHPTAKKWTVQRVDPSGGLFGVTAVSATSAWAVGGTSQYGDGHPLIAHWDGSTWTTQTFPDVDGQLARVGGHSDTEVMAVGSLRDDISPRMLTMHWDGANWTAAMPHHSGDVPSGLSAGPGSEYWGAENGSSGGAAFHTRFLAGQWRIVRGAQGSVKVKSHRRYTVPVSLAVARVPGSNTTLSVGYGVRAGNHLQTPAAALESTDQ